MFQVSPLISHTHPELGELALFYSLVRRFLWNKIDDFFVRAEFSWKHSTMSYPPSAGLSGMMCVRTCRAVGHGRHRANRMGRVLVRPEASTRQVITGRFPGTYTVSLTAFTHTSYGSYTARWGGYGDDEAEAPKTPTSTGHASFARR